MSERMTMADVMRQNEKVAKGSKTRPGCDMARFDAEKVSEQPKQPQQAVGRALRLVLEGQILGGKNNMIVTRTGLHFPKPSWAKWRDLAVSKIKAQLPSDFKPFDYNVLMHLAYTAGDRRRRDMPAVVDSLFHVLEKAGVVKDDTLIWVSSSIRRYDKDNPQAVMYIHKENM